MLASQIIFIFAGGGPYIVVTQMGRTSAEYGAWFAATGFAYLVGNLLLRAVLAAHSLEKLIWFGLALQFAGSLLNLVWSITGLNQAPSWLFGTQMIVMFANAFVMSNSAAGAISVRPEAAGTASGAMGFLQMGLGALVSQFGAYLGGHSTTPVPLNVAIVVVVDRLRLDDDLSHSAPRRGGQRGADREGGRGRVGDIVRNARTCVSDRHCERSEAIQLVPQQSWIASSPCYLAMTNSEPHSPISFSQSSSLSTATPSSRALVSLEPASSPATT